jgi:hypothetical protein
MSDSNTEQNEPVKEISVYKGKAYELRESPLFKGYAPIDSYGKPITLAYKGPKIPLTEWFQALGWMKHIYDKLGVECQLRLLEDRRNSSVIIVPFPQKYNMNSTLATEEVEPGDKMRQDHDLKYPASKYTLIGTVHHHCNIGASQSGADHSDELSDHGLHLTIGNLGSQRFSIHSRCYYHGIEYHVDYSNWFLSDGIAELIGEKVEDIDTDNDAFWELLLTSPNLATTPPTEWDNYMVDNTPKYTASIMGYGRSNHYSNSFQRWQSSRSTHGQHNASFWNNVNYKDLDLENKAPEIDIMFYNEDILADNLLILLTNSLATSMESRQLSNEHIVYAIAAVLNESGLINEVVTPDEVAEMIFPGDESHWSLRSDAASAIRDEVEAILNPVKQQKVKKNEHYNGTNYYGCWDNEMYPGL